MENKGEIHFKSYIELLQLFEKFRNINFPYADNLIKELQFEINSACSEIYNLSLSEIRRIIFSAKEKLLENVSSVSAALYLLNEEMIDLNVSSFYAPITFKENEISCDELLKRSSKIFNEAVIFKEHLGRIGISGVKLERFKSALYDFEKILNYVDDNFMNYQNRESFIQRTSVLFNQLEEMLLENLERNKNFVD